MSNIKDLINELGTNGEELLSLQVFKDVLDSDFKDADFYEDSIVEQKTCESLYNSYPYYKSPDAEYCIMTKENFNDYLKDLCSQLAGCLYDGFEQFLDTDSLYKYMLKDSYYIISTIKMIKQFDEQADLCVIDNIDYCDYNNRNYVIFEEV